MEGKWDGEGKGEAWDEWAGSDEAKSSGREAKWGGDEAEHYAYDEAASQAAWDEWERAGSHGGGEEGSAEAKADEDAGDAVFDLAAASTQRDASVLSYVTPTSIALGSAAPAGFDGYWDEDRGEAYAQNQGTGEIAYGVGADGDVYAVDYRSVLWVPAVAAAESSSSSSTRPAPWVSWSGSAPRRADAATLIAAFARRAQAWRRTCEAVVWDRFWRHYDAVSGFYYYEDAASGATQWHRPAVLVGTRRRRGLRPWPADVADFPLLLVEGGEGDYGPAPAPAGSSRSTHGVEEGVPPEEKEEEEEEEEEEAALVFPPPAFFLRGPYYARSGRGRTAIRAVNQLDPRSGSKYHRPALDRSDKFFVKTKEIESAGKWKLGDSVQAFDGEEVVRCSVEPYMLARGAAAKGPAEVVRTLQKFARFPNVAYFCLVMLAKVELREDPWGQATMEARACLLQTYKTLARYPKVAPIVSVGLAVLSEFADNSAHRPLIDAEPWPRICAEAMTALDTDKTEIITRDGGRRVEFHPTRHACDVATNVCRLFAAMAGDPTLRETYAPQAIPTAIQAMRFCDENATVQYYGAQCLYSFVCRSEAASIIADNEHAFEVVRTAAVNFASDATFTAMVHLTLRTLKPGGWRGVNEDHLRPNGSSSSSSWG